MRAAWFLLATALLALVGCSDDGGGSDPRPSTSASATPSATPSLGGPPVVRATPPTHAMDRLERPVAVRLARQVARQGLTLEYLDCPRWDGRVPSRMTCHGYLDGLRAAVHVLFTRAVDGKAVGFDAQLAPGVIATRTLEQTLDRGASRGADCGDVPAYPARAGDEIVCRFHRDGRVRYVVATVRGRSGAVTIADYRGTTGRR